jgi:hypothetical protein
MKRVSLSVACVAAPVVRQAGFNGRSVVWGASQKMLTAGALVLALPIGMALAADVTVGNPATKRASVDTYSNFTVVDTNHPVSAAGSLSAFQFYAGSKNPFEFVLVDKDNVVQWMSPTIEPSAEGVQTYTAAAPVPVQAGWNLGAHADATGVIPFDGTGAAMVTTANNAGKPAVGSKLTVYQVPSKTDNRTYSMNAATTAAAVATAKAATATATATATAAAAACVATGDECKTDADCCSGMTCESKTKNKTSKKTGKKTTTQTNVCEPAKAAKAEKAEKGGTAEKGEKAEKSGKAEKEKSEKSGSSKSSGKSSGKTSSSSSAAAAAAAAASAAVVVTTPNSSSSSSSSTCDPGGCSSDNPSSSPSSSSPTSSSPSSSSPTSSSPSSSSPTSSSPSSSSPTSSSPSSSTSGGSSPSSSGPSSSSPSSSSPSSSSSD